MARIEQRGPFLLLYALSQQLSSLLAQAMMDTPLRPAEFAVYSALRLEQPTTPTALARVLGQRLTTMSSQLEKMKLQGHLRRERNPRDGRSWVISLTPDGVRVTEACFPSFARAITSFRNHLEPDEAVMLAHLEAIGAALEAASQEISQPGLPDVWKLP